MGVLEFALPLDMYQRELELRLPAGALIVDAEPRYSARGCAAEGVNLLAVVENDGGDDELRRFILAEANESVPSGWIPLGEFDGKQLLMLDAPEAYWTPLASTLPL
jgi:hypothetical protein